MPLANLTNVQGSIIIAIVFPVIAATVIFVRLRQRGRERERQQNAELTLLERIEAMTNEEFEAWRAGGRREHQSYREQATGDRSSEA